MSDQLFCGEYSHVLDTQRRVSIPSSWRASQGEETRFYMLPGRYNSLQLLSKETFMDLMVKLRKVPFSDAKAVKALGQLGASAQECTCDKQGRISLSQKMKDYAQIDGDVVLVGAFTTAQIWSKDNWAKQAMDTDEQLDMIDSVFAKGEDLLEILTKNGGQ